MEIWLSYFCRFTGFLHTLSGCIFSQKRVKYFSECPVNLALYHSKESRVSVESHIGFRAVPKNIFSDARRSGFSWVAA